MHNCVPIPGTLQEELAGLSAKAEADKISKPCTNMYKQIRRNSYTDLFPRQQNNNSQLESILLNFTDCLACKLVKISESLDEKLLLDQNFEHLWATC